MLRGAFQLSGPLDLMGRIFIPPTSYQYTIDQVIDIIRQVTLDV